MSNARVAIKTLRLSLRELSDRDLQVDLWVLGKNGLHSSFIEACEGLMDDSGVALCLQEMGATGLGVELDRLLRALSEATHKVDHEARERDIIDSGPMDEVRSLAAKALAILDSRDHGEYVSP